jgi:hypothetical protein
MQYFMMDLLGLLLLTQILDQYHQIHHHTGLYFQHKENKVQLELQLLVKLQMQLLQELLLTKLLILQLQD